jgi:hypothetical protein
MKASAAEKSGAAGAGWASRSSAYAIRSSVSRAAGSAIFGRSINRGSVADMGGFPVK